MNDREMKEQEFVLSYFYGNNYIEFVEEEEGEFCQFFIDDEI